MYQILTAGNMFPVTLHCEKDPIKKHLCSCCSAAHNFLSVLGQANASPNHDQAVHLYLANLLPDLENTAVLSTYELSDS